MVEGQQNLLYNEFDNNQKFYRLLRAEAKLRTFAEIYPNSYIISIFACCRQMYDPSWMKGECLSKDEYLRMMSESEEIVKAIHARLLSQKEKRFTEEKTQAENELVQRLKAIKELGSVNKIQVDL